MTRGIGVAKNLIMEQCLKELSLHLHLTVVVQLFHGITVVTEGGDQVGLDSQT